ncbi:hypothetical protein H0G86_011572 [Trichoderma simmonsii]|uniref:Streptomycin biosynthesis protein StrI n=1 Tax=Trichoderma simmonsii TaxID=1491479 RepID=A0A8G0LPP4_9HYPO|nr:hypothetical protein H0G86_011572 [Trichoderma simmonsii]
MAVSPVTLLVLGAGNRGRAYAKYARDNPNLAQVVAVAEPRPERRRVFSKPHHIPEELQFDDWRAPLARGKIADAVIIAILDNLHLEAVAEYSKQGYHILCEKPMATNVADCIKMFQEVTSLPTPKVFGVGHVLRYSPYNQAVKEVIDSGAIGEIINIQHIEPVGSRHFAHSYVRGNWHKEADSTFALMAKCCHDIDILSFYLSGLKPLKVHSFGSLSHFKKSKKPIEAGDAISCLDCPYESQCAWSAKKIYLETLGREVKQYSQKIVDAEIPDIENVTAVLKSTAYGRCVYECDNDVVDHQVVNIEYEGGVTASMTMSAFTESECFRGTRIQGTKGELIGDMITFDVFDFADRTKKHYTPRQDGGNHGGGDRGIAEAFVASVANNRQEELRVTPREILDSHLLVFAAEKARREERVINFAQFEEDCMLGKDVGF